MLEQRAIKTLETIANTLVKTGQYKSQSEAIRAIALEQVDRKIAQYERQVKRFEKKHRTGFEDFGKRLQNRATLPQEDEWMEWEGAVEMLEEWRKARKALQN